MVSVAGHSRTRCSANGSVPQGVRCVAKVGRESGMIPKIIPPTAAPSIALVRGRVTKTRLTASAEGRSGKSAGLEGWVHSGVTLRGTAGLCLNRPAGPRVTRSVIAGTYKSICALNRAKRLRHEGWVLLRWPVGDPLGARRATRSASSRSCRAASRDRGTNCSAPGGRRWGRRSTARISSMAASSPWCAGTVCGAEVGTRCGEAVRRAASE